MCIFIFIRRLRYYTKEVSKIFGIIALGLILIIAIVMIKYKPTYIVSVSGEKLGYVESVEKFKETIKTEIIEYSGKNVESVTLKEEPSYELKLVDRQEETNEEEIIIALQKDATITYKYYEVAVNNDNVTYVDTAEDAENIVSNLKEKYADEDIELEIQVKEIVTEDVEEVKTENIEVAKASLEEPIDELVEIENSVPKINGIKLAVTPVSGTISSRYGSVSRLRVSTHTGLDIACVKGTPIKVVADGVVTFASYNGSYGNLIKVDHGNGVETWYAHCDAIYASVGDTVTAGDVIGAVGTTGNSTGPHLHLEIRINGTAVNPQNYLYN